jgi:hypothetical protein
MVCDKSRGCLYLACRRSAVGDRGAGLARRRPQGGEPLRRPGDGDSGLWRVCFGRRRRTDRRAQPAVISRDASSSSCAARSPCRLACIPAHIWRCTLAPRSARGRNGDRRRPARLADRCEPWPGAVDAPQTHPSPRAGSPPATALARPCLRIAGLPTAPPPTATSHSQTPPDMPPSPPASSRPPEPSRQPHGRRFRSQRQLVGWNLTFAIQLGTGHPWIPTFAKDAGRNGRRM